MGREKLAEYWFPGPVSSALRVLRAVKILSWDEVGYARLLEEWTVIPVHQSARTACLTIMGMTAVLGSVLIGKTRSDQTWLCICVPRVGWRRSPHPRGRCPVVSGLCCKVSTRPATMCVQQHLFVWWAVVCVTHTDTY